MPSVDPIHGSIDIDTNASLAGIKGLTNAMGSFRGALGVGAAAVIGFAGARGLQFAIQQSISWEKALAGVAKTVDASALTISLLGNEIIELSERIPIARNDLAKLAEIAGQLGVEVQNIPGFVEVVAALGVSTSLSAEDAAVALARLANVMGTNEQDFDRLGSAVVDLGNNFATTETEILALAQRLAAAGTIIGLSEGEVLGFATALSSVGIFAEAGGTAFEKLFLNLQTAVLSGSNDLQAFAKVADTSVMEFVKLFEEDSATAIEKFIAGIGGMIRAGQDVQPVLQAIGLNGARARRSILSIANASGVLEDALDRGNNAWDENNALQEEAARFYGTTESQQQLLKNQTQNLALAIGQDFLPAWRDMLEVAKDILAVIRDINSTPLTLALPPEIATAFDEEIERLAQSTGQNRLDAIAQFIGGGSFFKILSGDEVGRVFGDLNLLAKGIEFLADKATDAAANEAMDELGQQIFDFLTVLRDDAQEDFVRVAENILRSSDSIAEAGERIRRAFQEIAFRTGLEDLEVTVQGTADAIDDVGDKAAEMREKIDGIIESLEREIIQLEGGRRALVAYELSELEATDAIQDQADALIDQIEAFKERQAELEKAEAAEKALARDTERFVEGLRQEVIQLAAGRRGLIQYQLAQKGVSVSVQATIDELLEEIRILEQLNEATETAEERAARLRREFFELVDTVERFARALVDTFSAIGLFSSEVANLANSLINLGESIARVSQGDISGFATGGAAVGNIIASFFGESESERKARESRDRLVVQMELLRGSQDRLAARFGQFSGDTLAALDRFAAGATLIPAPGGVTANFNLESLQSLFGLSLFDMQEAAAAAGVEIDQLVRILTGTDLENFNADIAVDQFNAFVEAINLGLIAVETFTAAMSELRTEFEIFDITEPIAQLQRFRDVLLTFTDLPAEIRAEIATLDLTTEEGRARFDELIRELFILSQDPANRGIFGDLTRQEFQTFLAQQERLIDTIDRDEGGAGGTSSGFVVARVISDEQAGGLLSQGDTANLIADLHLQEARIQTMLLQDIAGHGVAGAGGGGGVSSLSIPVTIENLIVPEGMPVPEAIGAAVAPAVDRELSRLRERDRFARGHTRRIQRRP